MIEVQHLTKRYGPFTAVDDISFRVEKGEILGFLGPNGAGKTTTMRVLTGYMPATEGKAVVAGFDVFEQPLEAKRRTGYLPETPPLYPEMTVREYLDFVARIKIGEKSKADRRMRVDHAMKRTHVDDMANRHCSKHQGFHYVSWREIPPTRLVSYSIRAGHPGDLSGGRTSSSVPWTRMTSLPRS